MSMLFTGVDDIGRNENVKGCWFSDALAVLVAGTLEKLGPDPRGGERGAKKSGR